MKTMAAKFLGLFAVSLVLGGSVAHGQSVNVDSLIMESARVQHQLMLQELEGGTEALVSSSVGPFDVLTLERRRDGVVDAVQKRWERLSRLFEGFDHGRTALVITLWSDPSPLGESRLEETYDHVYTIHKRGYRSYGTQIGEAVVSVFDALMLEAIAEGPLKGWSLSERSDRTVTRNFLRVPLEAVTRCGQGEAEQCWRALGLVDADPSFHGWTTAEERRASVASLNSDRMVDEDRSRRLRCVRDRVDGMCDIIITSAASPVIPRVSGSARDHFLWQVMDNAEPGGFTRLVEAETDDVRTAVGSIGQRPPDEIILDWVQSLGADPEIRAREEKKDRWSAVLWIMILAIPPMRSRRWHSR